MILPEPDPPLCRRLYMEAVRAGTIVKPTRCECCPVTGKIYGHHTDYTRPLLVQHLCAVCHRKRHRPMIVPFCDGCGQVVLHKRTCSGQRPPTNRCGICRRFGHNCSRCPRGEALRRVCPNIRASWLQGRIAAVNAALAAVRERPLPSAGPSREFVTALERASHHLTYHASKPGPTEDKRERAREELAELAELLLRRAGIDPDALEAA